MKKVFCLLLVAFVYFSGSLAGLSDVMAHPPASVFAIQNNSIVLHLPRAANSLWRKLLSNKANKLSNGKFADVHWQLAGLYNKQNRFAEAAEELELYLKQNPKTSNRKEIEESIAKLREKVK